LENDKTNVIDELFGFITLGVKFYKIMGFWALVNHDEILIKNEDYSKKDFKKLSSEIFCLSDQSLKLCAEIKQMIQNCPNITFC